MSGIIANSTTVSSQVLNSTRSVTVEPTTVMESRSMMTSTPTILTSTVTSMSTMRTNSSTFSPPGILVHTTTMAPTKIPLFTGTNLYIFIGSVGCFVIIFLLILLSILACIITRRNKRSRSTKNTLKANVYRKSSDRSDLPLVKRMYDDDGEMDTAGDKCTPIPIPKSCFSQHVRQMHFDADRGFEDEFEALSTRHTSSYDISKLPHNIPKNRFENIFPYNFSRVVLSEVNGEEGTDYINASYIDGYNRKDAYIAAQGPLRNTIADFWRMIWEKNLTTIVMLTETFEAGREKCEQYWPALLNTEWNVGFNLAITLTEQKQYAEYRVKTLNVTEVSNSDSEVLTVTHYHFSAWPDHGVPADKTSMIQFIHRLRKLHPYYDTPPLLVHCSAGVGRSGTFIALDSMLQRMEAEDDLNIHEFVGQMRRKRALMVQTDLQYSFIHDALDEFITCGDTSILVTNIRVTMNKLSKVSPSAQSGFAKQFELLSKVSFKRSGRNCSEAASEVNASKNRCMDYVPYNTTRVILKGNGTKGADYINASFIDGYKHRRSFIATQGPLKSTADDFWRMIWEHKSRVIVMLCNLIENDTESCYQYWPQELEKTVIYGKLKVKMTSQKVQEQYTIRKFQIGEDTPYLIPGVPDGVVITHIQHTAWPSEGELTSTMSTSVLHILDEVLKVQMSTGNNAITVMCSDGAGRTGTFITVYSQIEKLKVEGMIDVFQFIKAQRLQRPNMVTQLEQFTFCHQLLADFLDTFDNYANFKDIEI